MIAALLCGLAFGALAVWERWARAERERRHRDLLETLPSDDDWPDPPLDAYEDWGSGTWPKHSGTIAIAPITPNVTVEGLPLDIWLQQFEPTTAVHLIRGCEGNRP